MLRFDALTNWDNVKNTSITLIAPLRIAPPERHAVTRNKARSHDLFVTCLAPAMITAREKIEASLVGILCSLRRSKQHNC